MTRRHDAIEMRMKFNLAYCCEVFIASDTFKDNLVLEIMREFTVDLKLL